MEGATTICGQLELQLLSRLSSGPARGDRLACRTAAPVGRVYDALRCLERDRLVTRAARGRSTYRLTRRGRRLLDGERREWLLVARALRAAA